MSTIEVIATVSAAVSALASASALLVVAYRAGRLTERVASVVSMVARVPELAERMARVETSLAALGRRDE